MDFAKLDLEDNKQLARIIIEKAAGKKFKNRSDFEKFRNALVKENKGKIFHNLYFIKAYNDLLRERKIVSNSELFALIQKRSVRTMSGVAPVTVMMKPFPCPGKCIYCPTDVRMPKSYLPSQPAAQRALRQKFNPYAQVFVRLKALCMTGHEISKVELRVLGGTWSYYTKRYQIWFLKRCLQAMNEFYLKLDDEKIEKQKFSWEQIVKQNETAKVRCIGINIETRADFIDKKEIRRLRYLGVTKVELGVQTTDDRVQEITKRGHDLESVRLATVLLKDSGFKIGYHMMPNLPGSTVELDKRMIGELFVDDKYQPDYLKIYPCVVVPKSILSFRYRKGLFKPYEQNVLEEILLEEMKSVPEWCRIDRIARDIPANDIEAGFKTSNIRQILEERLRKTGTPCRDIRAREIQNALVDLKNVKLVVRKYSASGGQEYFISYEDVKQDKLIALIRLRFPKKTFIPELKDAALIREIHVYGKQVSVGNKVKGEKQHAGWGTRLMNEAENLAKNAGYKKMAVIAGIGTREYYKKKNYRLVGTYMVKSL